MASDDIWASPGRLRTDAPTAARLSALARSESAIAAVAAGLVGRYEPGANGSVFCSARARSDRARLVVKLGADSMERGWMTEMARTGLAVVPRVHATGPSLCD